MKKEKVKPLIREIELEDISAVFALGEKLFTAEKATNLYRVWDEYELLECYVADKEFCLVAELEGVIIGFIIGTVIEKRKNAWTYGYVYWAGVDPDYKRLGVGKKLLDRLTKLFIDYGVRIMFMDTQAENEEALRFFKKNGFSNEVKHIYISKNLSTHPDYIRKKKKPKN